jgi:acetolactate synthase-1/2/3 large subunit
MTEPISAGMALLLAMHDAGIRYVFANLGSDHPALIEAMAEARATGRAVPSLLTCPNEMVALSIAHGFAAVGGAPQCVLVHVECGTQALAGAVHNAARGRAPVLIVAGASPFTQGGELPGGRNEFIHWIQDVHDQRGLVRGYMRYDAEVRTGRNMRQMLFRALQFARSDPQGPVYLMAAREVLEERVPPEPADPADWPAIAPGALPPEGVAALARALREAANPLVVTSFVGRRPEAVAELVRLADRLGLAVLDSVPSAVNFPADHPGYQGCQWNEPVQNAALAEADVVLVLDSDVPWIPAHSRPSAGAAVFHIDVDPIKQAMPLWHAGARHVFRADATTALRQLNDALEDAAPPPGRLERLRARHAARLHRLADRESVPTGAITAPFLTAAIRARLDANALVINEGISNYGTIFDHLTSTRAGAMVASGGGSLGWSGGAAIGAKLAHPEATVWSLCGDGSYMFSVPSSVHWMARQYRTPFLTVIYNNRGWKSPKLSTLAVHPAGYASRANEIGVSFDPPPDYAAIAAASGGAFARTVKRPEEVGPALDAALHAVRVERRAAVLDVWLDHL